ncbi:MULTISPECIES: winged helix-turn-helix transcriptional regulator [Sporolactobacillus]|jgi:DNA-binding HxlR family transcriptional regulator|uniref:Transcriptional regulator, HxlR family n=3 Tax=Sporolactobacillus TaxID=2077 RepID=A0A4Y3T9P0_9BACL|nr:MULTISPECIES: helix-turn-helix domain-containing protein [Sporolactobacillus]KLI01551.1 HxlR family transcriptional regulator [Sporolactobacillus inulinus CASD]GAY78802.1 transcriptional regulator, HxlR family [Sporolactobacillus inulinus]GEB78464.1 transcriptional regulator [Sporolactobacillus inulinus]SFG17136.1 transcriptional regulator, HxlR family [Sporolactobacillus nakayamae]
MTDVVRKDVQKKLLSGDYGCAKELTLSMFSGKWKIVILYHLGKDGIYRFGELKKLLPHASNKVLTQQLRELEEDELITRTLYPEVPVRVDYEITALGQTLLPIIDLMFEWGTNRLKQLKHVAPRNINEEAIKKKR